MTIWCNLKYFLTDQFSGTSVINYPQKSKTRKPFKCKQNLFLFNGRSFVALQELFPNGKKRQNVLKSLTTKKGKVCCDQKKRNKIFGP